MKTASLYLKNYLNTAQQFIFAELYTFTLADGTVLRYATGAQDIRLPANLITNSQQLDLFSAFGQASAVPNTTVANDGSSSADSLVEDSSIGTTHLAVSPLCTVPSAAADYTAYVYLKAGTRHWAAVQLFEHTASTSITCYFDLTNGVMGTKSAGAGWSSVTPRMVNMGGGWWRCSVSGTKINAATVIDLRVYLATANNTATYNGNGSSLLYVWGAQIDTAGFAADYVATGATPIASRTFDASSLIFTRGSVKTTIGVEVASLDLSVTADPSHLIGSTPWLQAVRQGVLDGASVLVERLIMPALGDYHLGTFIVFSGRVGDIPSFGRYSADITVNSDLELLNIPMPRNVYQPGCLNTLFDGSCTLSKAAFGVAGAIVAGTTNVLLYTDIAKPVGWFASGTISFTSGALAGVSVGIKDYSVVGRLSLYEPLTAVPAIGDTFTAYPGCPKTQSACTNSDSAVAPPFNNLIHFRGFPYVPAPETVT